MVARERAPDEEETCSILKNLLTDPQAGLTALESFCFCFFGWVLLAF